MHLRPVGPHDWQFLYDLLAERPEHANISHKEMPSLEQHIAFIRSNPYEAWYIIEANVGHMLDQPVPTGAVYLTKHNEIGIHIQKSHQRLGLAKEAIQQLMRQHPKPKYLANIAPMNHISQQLFINMGFNMIQHTFELKA